jgi:hypothetical protein
MDVVTAFLQGELDKTEELYMRQPVCTTGVVTDNKVCKLKRSLYGLKQAPRVWYQVLHEYLTQIGFVRCHKEYCMYRKTYPNGDLVILVVYVDDINIASNNINELNTIKSKLSERFKMKDLGELHYMLKMEVRRDRKQKILSISQQKYINDLLAKYNMEDTSIVDNPQIHGLVLKPGKTSPDTSVYPFDYRSLVGSLMYLVRGTRPDIANAVRELSKFLTCYTQEHMRAAKRVLQYLKGTSTYGLVFDGNSHDVTFELFTDASFARPEEDRRSITGYVTLMGEASLTWRSRKQGCISTSTQQAEMAALSEGVREAEWLRMLLDELTFKQNKPIIVWCDNNATIKAIENPCNHDATKHHEIHTLYAREVQEKGYIKVQYCSTHDMIADALTKALPTKQFLKLRDLMGVKDIFNKS